MLSAYACAVGICGLSLAAGRLVCWLAGGREWTWLAPGAGFAALLCIGLLAVRLPGHGWTALGAMVAVAVAGIVAPGLPRVPARADRQALAVQILPAAAATVIVVAAVSIPFVVSGRFGILGAGINNDLGFHLAWAELLASGGDADGLIAEHDPGYPIGPHALVASFAEPFGTLPAFTGLLIAIPVLTALAALTVLRDLRPGWRVAAAVATALPYMAASYFSEASFKETALALVVLTFALSLGELGRRPVARAGLVPGLAAVGALITFGRAGLVWPVGITAVWLVAQFLPGWREGLARIRSLAPALSAAAAVLVLGVATEIGRLTEASWTGKFLDHAGGSEAGGNFVMQIDPWPVLGGWPSAAFKLAPEDDLRVAIATAIALVAVLCGAVWRVRRRDLALPAAALAALLIYFYARETIVPYFSAKGMVVAAPLLALLAAGALFQGLPGARGLPALVRSRSPDAARAALGAAFIAALAWSSLLALGHGRVSDLTRAEELRSLRSQLGDEPTILLARDDYARWELLGVRMSNLRPYVFRSDVPATLRREKESYPSDFDSVSSEDLDRFRYAIKARSAYASAVPENWALLRTTPSFELWERQGSTPARETLPEGPAPGAVLDCDVSDGRALSRSAGIAAVRSEPVVGPATAWRGRGGGEFPRVSRWIVASPGKIATQRLQLPRGDWDLSLQYESQLSMEVRAADLRGDVEPATEPITQYWPIGSLTSKGGTVPVEVEVDEAPLGAVDRVARLQEVVATPRDWDLTIVPLRRACGRYVDWFRLDSGG